MPTEQAGVPSTTWARPVAAAMAVVLWYSNVLAPPLAHAGFWEERRHAVQGLRRAGGHEGLARGDARFASSLHGGLAVDVALAFPRSNPTATTALLAPSPGSATETPLVQPFGPPPPAPTQPIPGPNWLQTFIEAIAPYGTVRETHLSVHQRAHQPARTSGPGKQPPLVILIQDAHRHLEAQQNIAHILQAVGGQSKVQVLVGIEGASGPFLVDRFRQLPDQQILKKVATWCFHYELLTGPEYAGLTVPSPLLLWGVDDGPRYAANVHALRESLARRPQAEVFREQLASHLESLKTSAYPPALIALDRQATAFHSGQLTLRAYLAVLQSASHQRGVPPTFPHLRQFTEALAQETQLNFSEIARQRALLIGRLHRQLPDQDRQALLEASAAYRLGSIDGETYYHRLATICRQRGVSLATFPQFQAYVRYVLLTEAINHETLFREFQTFEEHTWAQLLLIPDQRVLFHATQLLTLLTRLMNHTLTPPEWEIYQRRRPEVLAMLARYAPDVSPAFLLPFEQFYREAEARNHALVHNLLNKTRELQNSVSSPRMAVLVAGGFHTPGVGESLKAQHIPYLVLAPQITHAEDGAKYLEVFARGTTPLEQLFTGKKLTLNPPSGLAERAVGYQAQGIQAAALGTLASGVFALTVARVPQPQGQTGLLAQLAQTLSGLPGIGTMTITASLATPQGQAITVSFGESPRALRTVEVLIRQGADGAHVIGFHPGRQTNLRTLALKGGFVSHLQPLLAFSITVLSLSVLAWMGLPGLEAAAAPPLLMAKKRSSEKPSKRIRTIREVLQQLPSDLIDEETRTVLGTFFQGITQIDVLDPTHLQALQKLNEVIPSPAAIGRRPDLPSGVKQVQTALGSWGFLHEFPFHPLGGEAWIVTAIKQVRGFEDPSVQPRLQALLQRRGLLESLSMEELTLLATLRTLLEDLAVTQGALPGDLRQLADHLDQGGLSLDRAKRLLEEPTFQKAMGSVIQGCRFQQARTLEAAMNAFTQAVRLSPDDQRFQIWLGGLQTDYAAWLINEYQRRMAEFEQLPSSQRQRKAVLPQAWGRLLDQAEPLLREAFRRLPRSIAYEAFNNWGGLLLLKYGEAKEQEAIQAYKQSIAIVEAFNCDFPVSKAQLAGLYVRIGVRYYKQGALAKAVEHLQAALSYHPRLIRARFVLIGILGVQERYQECIAEIEKAIRSYQEGHWEDPVPEGPTGISEGVARLRLELPRFYNEYGTQLLQGRNYPSALEKFRRALELAPDYGVALSNVGYIELIQGNVDKALDWLTRAVEVDLTAPIPHFNLAAAYWLLNDLNAMEQELASVETFADQQEDKEVLAMARQIRANQRAISIISREIAIQPEKTYVVRGKGPLSGTMVIQGLKGVFLGIHATIEGDRIVHLEWVGPADDPTTFPTQPTELSIIFPWFPGFEWIGLWGMPGGAFVWPWLAITMVVIVWMKRVKVSAKRASALDRLSDLPRNSRSVHEGIIPKIWFRDLGKVRNRLPSEPADSKHGTSPPTGQNPQSLLEKRLTADLWDRRVRLQAT